MIYRFSVYQLDTQLFALRSADTPLQLEPKVFDLLTHFVRSRDRVVTKQDLLTHDWPQQFVSDSAPSYCIMAARKAVGDSGREQRVIKTLHERGYRFVALVEWWFELPTREGPAETDTSDGVRTYADVGLGPRRSSLEVYGKRPLSGFVGRERELAELHDRLSRVEKGRGQIVGLVGEPGVGKSRLCYELSQSPRAHGWLILETGPVAYDKDIPYFPVVDLLKIYFLLDARDEARTLHAKIATKLQTLDEGLRSILPPLLALLDLPVEDPPWQALDPSQRRQLTLDALKRLLMRESQVHPVLLIVENLHWIDTETQAFLDGLVNSLPTAGLLLLVNYRPEYQHHWGRKTYYTPLRLDPLGPERTAEFWRSLIGVDATLAPLNQHLIRKTEGNPYLPGEHQTFCRLALGEAHLRAGHREDTRALPYHA